MRESDIEKYLVQRVKELGGECRKVKWIGRDKAPDRVLMLPARDGYGWAAYWGRGQSFWVEVKNPETIKTFPANAHERGQAREHKRMRDMGQRVEVIGTIKGVDDLLA